MKGENKTKQQLIDKLATPQQQVVTSELANVDPPADRQEGPSDQRKIAKSALVIFLPAFVLTLAVTVAILFNSNTAEMITLRNTELHTIAMQALNIGQDIAEVSSDLAILVHGRITERVWNEGEDLIPGGLAELSEDYLNILIYRRLYDKARLIDESGMEILRVNYSNGHPAVVPQEKLQNKKGRYYFDDAFMLDRGEVFVSPLDLNIEHGEIEQLLKPVIRFAMPVFDRQGEKRGIVLLNYLGARLLENFTGHVNTSRGSQAMLLNADGYWLKGPNPEDEWGFMYEDRKDRTFANAYPEAWKRIKFEESVQFETPQGLFTSRTVYPLLDGQKSSTGSGEAFASSQAQLVARDYYWKVVSFAPSEVLYAARNYRYMVAALVLAFLALAMFIGAWRMARSVTLRKQAEDALQKAHDGLEIRVKERTTEFAKANEGLWESNQQVRDLLDSTAEAIYGLDMQGNCTFANLACMRMLGYQNAGELVGRNMHDLIHHKRPDGTPYPQDECPIFHAFLSGNGTHVDTEVLWRAGGSSFPAEYWSYPIHRGGEVIGAVVTFLDITERKRSEGNIKRASVFMQAVIDGFPDALMVINRDYTIALANRMVRQLAGGQDPVAAYTKCHQLSHGREMPCDTDEHLCPMQEVIGTKAPISVKHIHYDAQGHEVPVEIIAAPIFDEKGEVVQIIESSRDITERKQFESEQERLQRELHQAQKMEALGQLTGGIAHDFNNILGIIMGYSELARGHCISKGEAKLTSQLDRILEASGRARDLVAQMMAFSRSGASDDKPLLLQPLVKEDLKMLSSTLPTSIEITTEIEENLSAVLMDPGQLNQLLMNLCVNARDAMEGKGNLTIGLGWASGVEAECATCHKQLEGDWVELSITDTGSGISPEALDRIFDPFFTTKEVGKGTGMGMAVIHGIMRNHGGHVLVETEQGKGTTFRLLFPPVVEETAETQKAVSSSTDLPRGQGEHVLVVDDEPDLGEFIGDLLEHYDYKPTVLTSSKKAVELFNEKPNEFALVITDQTMPGITGKVLVKNLREVRPDIPVILNTGFSEDIDAEAAARMGIRYLEKPVRVQSLIQAVGELLRPTEQTAE